MGNMKIIGKVRTDFSEKFGTPRQSGLVWELKGKIEFEPEYRNKEAFRGLEEYSYIWVLWEFSESIRTQWSPTVKPPRLGGNRRMGVFATRSPFRPNPIGLSCVRLDKVCFEGKNAPYLIVSGIDMMDNTPVYDIKPYLTYTDSHTDAVCGFADMVMAHELKVVFPKELENKIPYEKRAGLTGMLKQDIRPGYRHEPDRIFGVSYAGMNVKFTVSGDILTVCEVENM